MTILLIPLFILAILLLLLIFLGISFVVAILHIGGFLWGKWVYLFVRLGFADINISYLRGQSLLHYAAEYGDYAMAKKLIELGIDINQQDVYGSTALIIACEKARNNCDKETASNSQSLIVTLLLAHHADTTILNYHGLTAADIASDYVTLKQLFDAGGQPNPDIAEKIRAAEINEVNAKLDEALATDNPEFVKLIYPSLPAAYRQECLFEAVSCNNPNSARIELINLLLKDSVPSNMSSYTPSNFSVNAIDPHDYGGDEIRYEGGTPLIYTIAQSFPPATIQALIDHGANTKYKDLQGRTALMFVHDQPEHIDILLAAGADINAQDTSGKTALMTLVEGVDLPIYPDYLYPDSVSRSVFWGSSFCIEHLVNRGADITLRDNEGYTAHDYAKEQDRHNLLYMLEIKN